MPQTTPPPTVHVPFTYQEQGQSQGQSSISNSNYSNDNLSNSQAESRNEVIQSPISSNTQINNNNDTYFGFGVGITRPTSTLNATIYHDEYGGTGGSLTFSIPLGGRSSKLSSKLITERTRTVALSNAAAEMSFCNSMYSQGITINYSMLPDDHPAHQCNGLIIAKQVEVQKPSRSSEIQKLREDMQKLIEQNRQLQVQNQKMRNRLETKYNSKSNPFVYDGH